MNVNCIIYPADKKSCNLTFNYVKTHNGVYEANDKSGSLLVSFDGVRLYVGDWTFEKCYDDAWKNVKFKLSDKKVTVTFKNEDE